MTLEAAPVTKCTIAHRRILYGPFAHDQILVIYYGKMVMVRSNENAAEAAPLVCEDMYIKSLLESCSSVALDSKNEMNTVYSAL